MITTINNVFVCDKARTALNNIDDETELYNKNTFDNITDFFTIDMTEYVDFRLPLLDIGIIIKENTGQSFSIINLTY